ncbi:MAG: tail fiber domain-containing protein, partial [Bdellovibrio sp.]
MFLLRRLFFSIAGFLFVFSLNSYSLAAPTSLTYQGRILKSDGTPLEYNNVSFIFQITDPSGQCVIYQEQVNGINMVNSAGVFDVPIGNGTIQYPLGGTTTILDIFNNSSSFTCGSCSSTNGSYTCTNGSGNYAASATDVRKLRVSFYDGSGWKLITPDNIVRSVPFAGYALSAQKLGTHVETDFLFKAGLPTCGAGTFLSYDGTALSCLPVSGASGGTVTNVTSSNSYLTVINNTSTPTLMVNVGAVANTVAAGDDPRFSDARIPTGAAGGVLNGVYPNPGLVDSSITNTKISDGAVSTSKLFANPGVNRLVATDPTTGSTLAPLTCASGQLLTWNVATGWQCSNQSSLAVGSATVAGSATNFTGTLAGDISGTQGATSVDKIKGLPLDFSVPPSNGQVLKFDGTSWVPAADNNTGSQWTTSGLNVYYNTGNVGIGTTTPSIKLEVTGAVKFGMDSTTCSAAIAGAQRYNSGNMEYCNGTAWTTYAASGAGVAALNGLTSNTQTFAVPGTSGTAPAWSSSGSTHTLNIPMASGAGVTAGLLAKTDYDAFNSKLGTSTNFSGDVSGAYNSTSVDKIKGTVVSASAPTSSQFLVYDGTTQYTPVSMSGDATMSTAGAVTLKNTGTAGTYTKVTTDAQGRVTSGTTLSA